MRIVRLSLVVAVMMLLALPATAETDSETLARELAEGSLDDALRELDEKSTAPAVETAGALGRRFFEARRPRDGVAAFEYAVERGREAPSSRAYAEALQTLSIIRYQSGQVRDAMRLMEQTANAFGDIDAAEDELLAVFTLSNFQHGYGMLQAALTSVNRVLDREEEIGDEMLLADILAEAAMIRYKLGRMEDIPGLLERAEQIYADAEDPDGLGRVYRTYGNYHIGRDSPETAIEYYERAAEQYEKSGNPHGYANTSFNLGLTYVNLRQPRTAVEYLENAIENFAGAGSRAGAGMAGTELGRVLLQLGRLEEAERMVSQAIDHLRQSQSMRRLAQAYVVYGVVHEARDQLSEAERSYQDAINLYEDLGIDHEAEDVRNHLDRVQTRRLEEQTI